MGMTVCGEFLLHSAEVEMMRQFFEILDRGYDY